MAYTANKKTTLGVLNLNLALFAELTSIFDKGLM